MQLDADAVLWDHAEDPDAPLLVLLHGLGSHEGDLFGLVPHLPAELNIASLRAPLVTPYGGRAWFDIEPQPEGPPLHRGEQIDAAGEAVVEWLDSLGTRFTRIGLLGFSQGAAITLKVASMIPERLQCVVALSGLLPKTLEDAPRTNLPAFVAVGDFDTVITADRSAQFVEWAETHLDATVRHYPMTHQVIAEELADIRQFLDEHLA
ncbi:dienelactone hydrolase family protein [Tessaracoccus sp. SD287]|uniref:alpha/beta hydrolase n=1 Tax=Tessaracoccus sp. SD287 TaxID=2782008 RepID=UPI001A968EB7|nr:alpha/beta fold hydrolase [Tessaracoccus sp. SD287]MBO1030063.1 dienelactone hydrolase family protein [Tessaracoccus sp. SD287]